VYPVGFVQSSGSSEQGMAAIQREFYRSARGPTPADNDWWCLVFAPETNRLFVRHEWQGARHNGVDEFEIAEFLEQDNAARNALMDDLFRVHANA
jgi:hypothetical protein